MSDDGDDAKRREVEERLGLLAIFHYVVGGMACFFGLIPIIHLVIGIAVLSGAFEAQGGESVPAILGLVFVIIGGGAVLLAQGLGIAIIVSGRRIAARRMRTFSLVMGGIMCVFMPFGTVLGAFTLLLLSNEDYRRVYDEAAADDRRRPGAARRALRAEEMD